MLGKLFRNLPSWFLSIFKDGDSTISTFSRLQPFWTFHACNLFLLVCILFQHFIYGLVFFTSKHCKIQYFLKSLEHEITAQLPLFPLALGNADTGSFWQSPLTSGCPSALLSFKDRGPCVCKFPSVGGEENHCQLGSFLLYRKSKSCKRCMKE